jgi:WD40 repeat protein
VAYSADGKRLASASRDSTIKLWDPATGKLLRTLAGHPDSAVFTIAFSPDGKTLASGSEDKTIKLWDTATGAQIGHLGGHKDWVNAIAFSPDGKTLASGSDDNTVRLWDVASRRQVHAFIVYNSVFTVAFSPDGGYSIS